ncbi:ABC transporter permease [uncultured Friedmanniella sp.]|uniref:ABC transporter permease n=1 Tax=uncultured Friedmanniella sp. TaxID=335381 RepID=UPI0035CAE817
MSTATKPARPAMVETPVTTELPPEEASRFRLGPRGLVLIGTLVVWLVLRLVLGGQWTLAIGRSDLTGVHENLNALNDWVGENRNSSPIFLYFFNYIQIGVEGLGSFFTALFSHTDVGFEIPQIGWLGTTVLLTFLAWAVGNVRVAALTLVGLLVIVSQGLWAESMDTFALVLAAVLLALLIGLPLGIWAGTNDRVHKIITPVLDFMQILPSFAYLAPLVLLFMIGPAPAIVATWIFAVPPVIRLTAHGIRQVPATTREAVDSLGVSGLQRLRAVLLPMAKRTVVIGINQTIMAALSMVTIAALIGAPGLGLVVTQALQSLDVGTAFNGGVAIVILAIIFDRVTTAASMRSELAVRSGKTSVRGRRIAVGVGAVVTLVAIYLSRTMLWAATPPTLPDVGGLLTTVGDSVSSWTQTNLSFLTQNLRDHVTNDVLNPLEALLTGSPWFVVGAVLVVVGYLAGRWRTALLVVVAVGLMVWLGVWNDAMATLAATVLATVIVMVLGLVLGVWMGRSTTVDKIVRPVLDAAQTMPAFVYLVPFLALFGATRFTAIVAAVVYAAPPAIKIIADGISQVAPTTMEAAQSSGSTAWQMITKVQIPMSAKAIGLAANQGLIYALSMVVIGGMVGAGALGYDVVAGLAQLDLFGKGLAAGLTLVVMGILLDRVTQAATDRSRDRSAPALVKRPRGQLGLV